MSDESSQTVDPTESGGQNQDRLDIAVSEMSSHKAQDLFGMLADIAGSFFLKIFEELFV